MFILSVGLCKFNHPIPPYISVVNKLGQKLRTTDTRRGGRLQERINRFSRTCMRDKY